MEEDVRTLVYSRDVLDFVAVATEYCTMMDALHEYTQEKLVHYSLKLLPLLYMKAHLLPDFELEDPELVEKYVSEEEWNKINLKVAKTIAQYDSYTESEGRFETNEQSSVAENFADIYQDIRDFVHLYSTGVDEMMHDGIAEVKRTFKQYWGQRLVNLLRILHHIYFNEKLKETLPSEEDSTEEWMTEQRKKEWGIDE